VSFADLVLELVDTIREFAQGTRVFPIRRRVHLNTKTGELTDYAESFVQDGNVIPVSEEIAAKLKPLPLKDRVDVMRDKTELEKLLTGALGGGGGSAESVADGSNVVPPAGSGEGKKGEKD
jgi:hypothetical protein